MASCTQTIAYSDYLTDGYGGFPAGIIAPRYIEATVTVSVCAVPPCPANARTVTTRAVKFLP